MMHIADDQNSKVASIIPNGVKSFHLFNKVALYCLTCLCWYRGSAVHADNTTHSVVVILHQRSLSASDVMSQLIRQTCDLCQVGHKQVGHPTQKLQ